MKRLSMPSYNDLTVSQLGQANIYKNDFIPFFSIYISKTSPRQGKQSLAVSSILNAGKEIYLEILHGES